MKYLLKNGTVFKNGCFEKNDILIHDGIFISETEAFTPDFVYDLSGLYIFPGFVDVHVHFREPGFSYKETIKTGSLAAAHGGFTSVCSMPNLSPCPDCYENLNTEIKIIRENAVINVYPYAAVTKSENGVALSDIPSLAADCIAFSDDGRGIQSSDITKSAMTEIKNNNKLLAAHCEDNGLLEGGYIHKGEYALIHGHRGICSASEWKPIERDIALSEETSCKYHVCHISTKESVRLIRRAKQRGIDISCETAPHYLCLDDSMLKEDGRYKMNPPIRSKSDREELLCGILDGTIDMIATDHAPHSAEEKSKGLKDSLMGVVGLETAFPVLYTDLVKTKLITLEKLISLMSVNPARRFGIGGEIKPNESADLCVYDLNSKYIITPENFLSKGRSTPFDGKEVFGECVLTICGGKTVWKKS